MKIEKVKFTSAKDLLLKNDFLERISKKPANVSTEYQDYGLRLASRLNDNEHKTLYIKLAKDLPRGILETAVQFALDYPERPGQRGRGRIFMWKLKQVCLAKKVMIPATIRSYSKKKIAQRQQIKLLK